MKIGEINKLKVLRQTDLGYILEKEDKTVFLHFNETNNQVLKEDQIVDAYLYYDHKNRLTASLQLPIITLDEQALLSVVGVNNKIGVFVDIGVQKDLLVSKDFLPLNLSYWPQKGDKIYIKKILKNRLVGKPLLLTEIKEFVNYNLNVGDKVDCYVVQRSENGLNCLTEENQLIFIHHTQKRKNYRLGEKLEATIIRTYDKALNGSLIKQKEQMMVIDSEAVLNYLKAHKKVPLTNHSSPEEIKKYFKMSKRAFKRAIGILYKEQVIKFDENNIIYIGDKNE